MVTSRNLLTLLWQIYSRGKFAQIRLRQWGTASTRQSSDEVGDSVAHGWQACKDVRNRTSTLSVGFDAAANVANVSKFGEQAVSRFLSGIVRTAEERIMTTRHYFLWQSFVLVPCVAIGISAAIDFTGGGFDERSLTAVTFWLLPGMIAYATAIAVSAVYVRRRREVFDTLLSIAAAGVLTGVASLGLGYVGLFPFFMLLQFAASFAAWRTLDRLSEFGEGERTAWPEDENGRTIRQLAYYFGLLGFYIIPMGWTVALYSLNDGPTSAVGALDLLFAAAQIGYAVWLDRKPLRARVFQVVSVTSTTRRYFLWQSLVFVLPMAIAISSGMSFGVPESEPEIPEIILLGNVLAGGWVSYVAVIVVSAMYVRKLREVFIILLPIAAAGVLIGLFIIWTAVDVVSSLIREAGHPSTIIYLLMLGLLQLTAPIAAWIVLETLTAFEAEKVREKIMKKGDAWFGYFGILGFYMLPALSLLITFPTNVRSTISIVVAGLWFVATEVWYAMWLDRKYFGTRVDAPIS